MTRSQRRSFVRSTIPLLLSLVALLAGLGALAYVIVANAHRVDDIADQQKTIRAVVIDVQKSRFDATLRACQLRNDQNGGIRYLVRRGSLELRAIVASRFPVEPDCRAYAERSVRVR